MHKSVLLVTYFLPLNLALFYCLSSLCDSFASLLLQLNSMVHNVQQILSLFLFESFLVLLLLEQAAFKG